jgi:hypothetical protein
VKKNNLNMILDVVESDIVDGCLWICSQHGYLTLK